MQDKIDVFPSQEVDGPERVSIHHLPAQLTPLFGREQEVQDVCALLQRPEVRLLVLVGPGGVGKTRLGVQIAANMLDYFVDGVSFVSLAPISDSNLVISTIAGTLDPTLEDVSLARLKAYIQGKQLLLLLDNFEQVAAAAPLIMELLISCPRVKVLVTSRMVLRVQDEYDFFVLPLALPDLTELSNIENLASYPSVALFLQRAQAVAPDFQLTNSNAHSIVEICTRLDGLPLAIELAAARLNLLSPQSLLARLEHRFTILTSRIRDVPVRQQTLRNTLEWSYGLLTQEEQQVFRRISVFVGSCTLEAVEAICATPGDDSTNILDRVTSLLDKSLLQRTGQEGDEPRLRLLETIREFGLECLGASGEMEVIRQAHATYYLSMLEKAWQNALGIEEWHWYARLEQEHDNLRAALQWSVEQGGVTGAEAVLRLGLALARFWQVRGHVSEGRRWLELALAHGEEYATLGRARGLVAAGILAFAQDAYDPAEAFLKESVETYQKLADPGGMAFALERLGQLAMARGNYTLACSLTQESLTHVGEVGDRWNAFGISITPDSQAAGDKWYLLLRFFALDNLVRVAIAQGEYGTARSLIHECLMVSGQADDRRNKSVALFHLALLAFAEGEQRAVHLLEESLTISREIHYKWSLAFSLALTAIMVLQQGNERAVQALLEEALTVRRQVGDRWGVRWGIYCLGWVAFEHWDKAAARDMYVRLISILRELDDTEFLVTCLEGLGSKVAAQALGERPKGGSHAGKQSGKDLISWAVRLWGTAEALREASNEALHPNHGPVYQQTFTAVRSRLSKEAFTLAWVEG